MMYGHKRITSLASAAITAASIMVFLSIDQHPSSNEATDIPKVEEQTQPPSGPSGGLAPQGVIPPPPPVRLEPVTEIPSPVVSYEAPVVQSQPSQVQEPPEVEEIPVYRDIQNVYPTVDQTENTPEVFSHPPVDPEPVVEVLTEVEGSLSLLVEELEQGPECVKESSG